MGRNNTLSLSYRKYIAIGNPSHRPKSNKKTKKYYKITLGAVISSKVKWHLPPLRGSNELNLGKWILNYKSTW